MKSGRKVPWSNEENGKVLLCDNIPSVDVLRLATDHNIRQIVQSSNPKPDLERNSGLVMLNSPVSFFDFPLSTVLFPREQPSQELEVKASLGSFSIFRSLEKRQLLDQIEAVVRSVSSRQSLVEDITLVSDELISNAIFNAPFQAPRLAINRTELVELLPEQAARVSIGADNERLVIVCQDCFGSLDIGKFLTRIKNCYERGRSQMINLGDGGAGIGSHMIFEACTSMFCGVDRGRKTIFACVFPLNRSHRFKMESSKNIHFVER